uniref:Uncharacterized protein n=1 Tax=Arundo donax TaxID=35708 RepID=A0A0A8ZN60_ARUDO
MMYSLPPTFQTPSFKIDAILTFEKSNTKKVKCNIKEMLVQD